MCIPLPTTTRRITIIHSSAACCRRYTSADLLFTHRLAQFLGPTAAERLLLQLLLQLGILLKLGDLLGEVRKFYGPRHRRAALLGPQLLLQKLVLGREIPDPLVLGCHSTRSAPRPAMLRIMGCTSRMGLLDQLRQIMTRLIAECNDA
jgi:hypothetical protein